MHVGFIGLGSQGGPMAGRIIEAGFPTSLWARRPAALEPFTDTAAKVAGAGIHTGQVGRVDGDHRMVRAQELLEGVPGAALQRLHVLGGRQRLRDALFVDRVGEIALREHLAQHRVATRARCSNEPTMRTGRSGAST